MRLAAFQRWSGVSGGWPEKTAGRPAGAAKKIGRDGECLVVEGGVADLANPVAAFRQDVEADDGLDRKPALVRGWRTEIHGGRVCDQHRERSQTIHIFGGDAL